MFRLTREVRIDEPGWFAVRIDAKTTNELDQRLFAHSSPVYFDVAGKRVFDLNAAEALLRQIEQGEEEIRTRGKFTSGKARDALLAIHDEAIKELKDRINRRGQ